MATSAAVGSNDARPLRVVAVLVIPGLLLAGLAISLAAWVGSHAPAQSRSAQSTSAQASNRVESPAIAGSVVVARADGTPIPMRELQVYLDRERSGVLAHDATGGEATDARFWTTPVQGITPGTRIVDAALGDAVQTTVTLQLAREHGLVVSADYTGFLRALNAENERRKTAIKQHQPIYGPQQYTESGYLDYLLGEYEYALGPLLVADGTIVVTEQTIAAFAVEHPEVQGATDPSRLTQLRQLYLAEQVKQIIAKRATRADVIRTDTMAALGRSGCLVSGACTSDLNGTTK